MDILRELSDRLVDVEQALLKKNNVGKIIDFDIRLFKNGGARVDTGELVTDFLPVLMPLDCADYGIYIDIGVGSDALVTDIDDGYIMPIVSSSRHVKDKAFYIRLGSDSIVHDKNGLKIESVSDFKRKDSLLVNGRKVQSSLENHDQQIKTLIKAVEDIKTILLKIESSELGSAESAKIRSK